MKMKTDTSKTGRTYRMLYAYFIDPKTNQVLFEKSTNNFKTHASYREYLCHVYGFKGKIRITKGKI